MLMALAPILVAVRRPRDLRHHRGQHRDRVCLCGRRDAAGAARGALRYARRCLRRRIRVRAGARRACRQRSIRGCRSGSPPGFSLLNGLYGLLGAAGIAAARTARRHSPGGAPIRSARSSCCARTQNSFGLASVSFLGNLAHAVLPSVGVLYMIYRYGWDERTVGLDHGGRRGMRHHRAGRPDRAGGQAVRRARGADDGAAFGVAGFVGYGGWRRRVAFLAGIPLMALWGFANPAAARL